MEAEKTVLILGAIKILLGFLYLVCTIVYNVEIGSPNVITFVGCIPLLVSGILAVLYACRRSRGMLIGVMVVSIIVTIILAIGAIILGLAVGAIDACGEINQTSCIEGHETKVNLLRSFVAFAVLGCIATFTTSIIGCARVCCKSGGENNSV